MIELHDPIQLASAPRVIRYSIATQYRNGAYQRQFNWNDIDFYLTFLERYWNIDFQRVTRGGTLSIIQANTQLNPTAFAWTRGTQIFISPTAKYQNNPWLCGMVLCHEFGHAAGGSSHNRDASAIMSTNGGTVSNFVESDYAWFRPYQWRSVLRPHHEPNFMRQYFTRSTQLEVNSNEERSFACGCDEGTI